MTRQRRLLDKAVEKVDRTHAPWLDIPRVFGIAARMHPYHLRPPEVMRSKNLTKCFWRALLSAWPRRRVARPLSGSGVLAPCWLPLHRRRSAADGRPNSPIFAMRRAREAREPVDPTTHHCPPSGEPGAQRAADGLPPRARGGTQELCALEGGPGPLGSHGRPRQGLHLMAPGRDLPPAPLPRWVLPGLATRTERQPVLRPSLATLHRGGV